MISIELATRLRDAGLHWRPTSGDRFFIPDRDLEDQIFTVSEMTIDVRPVPGGQVLAFNGTVEWALDAIMQQEVVWLPDESQLREALGSRFVSLTRIGDGYRCEITGDGNRMSFEDDDADCAYGLALLAQLERGRRMAGAL